MQFSLPYFGEINLQQLEERYDADTDTGVSLDINFDKTSIDAERAELIKQYLQDLDALEQQCLTAIQEDYQIADSSTYEYTRFWMEELTAEELAGLVGEAGSDEEKAAALLSRIQLKRVGFYPDGAYGAPQFATFDYGIKIDDEFQDLLIVVQWNDQRGIDYITTES
ncbi:DUF2004 domain-containing protein [Chitinophaga qingshengii]|uniref:DUF2004 domain-containing protein n=1 Tax=Chitinophaga qingshengii TaxID=1569794 RepID=A0ABR7TH32_9BACT|nr:DUF2004 domain-containing protein [Chitinophaga qingshengii]MBC9929797.1 DUF2004 domain-containing protein [Chitinophaga qingshengii]